MSKAYVTVVVGLVLAATFAPTAGAMVEPCCFTNQRYSGVCQVVPGQDETCGSILSYLNTPNSTGKAYCAGTDIRGGWTQVDCKASAQSTQTTGADAAAPTTCPATATSAR